MNVVKQLNATEQTLICITLILSPATQQQKEDTNAGKHRKEIQCQLNVLITLYYIV